MYEVSVKQDKNTHFTDIRLSCWKRPVTVNIQQNAEFTEIDQKFSSTLCGL
jgi:hypothetical protein